MGANLYSFIIVKNAACFNKSLVFSLTLSMRKISAHHLLGVTVNKLIHSKALVALVLGFSQSGYKMLETKDEYRWKAIALRVLHVFL